MNKGKNTHKKIEEFLCLCFVFFFFSVNSVYTLYLPPIRSSLYNIKKKIPPAIILVVKERKSNN